MSTPSSYQYDLMSPRLLSCSRKRRMTTFSVASVIILLSGRGVDSKLADRRRTGDSIPHLKNANVPMEGPNYRILRRGELEKTVERRSYAEQYAAKIKQERVNRNIVSASGAKVLEKFDASPPSKKKNRVIPADKAPIMSGGRIGTAHLNLNSDSIRSSGSIPGNGDPNLRSNPVLRGSSDSLNRQLSNQLSGCCSTYQKYSASSMCSLYGQDCESGETPSHDSNDEDCSQAGLSFIGVSFSVWTNSGNPYSYQLCDQFPMENIIDRDYSYVMSMDEDGWLVGGGYKTFDHSGKMPYVDSSHTELLRIGSLDTSYGGTSISQVYDAMSQVDIPPLKIFPEYLKGGGGGGDGDEGSVPSTDVTLIVSVVDEYDDDGAYSIYESFLYELFSALDAVGSGACMDDHDTDPHVSMSRGLKFKSSYHATQFLYDKNLEIATWQAMYPKGVTIGSTSKAVFPLNSRSGKQSVGYGALYFFFDRANITKAFTPNRDLYDNEEYYATLYSSGNYQSFYDETTEVGFDYGGSGDGDANYEHNPYNWKADMAMHDPTDGWDLPPNCKQEGETFFGIPLSRKSASSLQSSPSFQEQFNFEHIIDRNFTYIQTFGTNHGWLVGESVGNGAGSIVDKDTSHIPIFYLGTTNINMGGVSLQNMIKLAKQIDFGILYIKPAFVYIDSFGHVKLQFEADSSSALGYLYNALCSSLGITWNYDTPSNSLNAYTNCAMHAAGDRAQNGCGPNNGNSGGFCPQMTVAYSVRFQSEDTAAAYLDMCNNYVDYWRKMYPSGVAVGTSSFCEDGGCLGLFLNRMDLYQVFKPNLGGSWVEYGDGTMAPTVSHAPTWKGGCDEPHNFHLDRCMMKNDKHRKTSAVIWDSFGAVGQFSILLVTFMATTLTISIFLARARRRRRKGESYIEFFIRDMRRKRKPKKLRRKKRSSRGLDDDLLSNRHDDDDRGYGVSSTRSRGSSRKRDGGSRRSKSRGRSSRGDSRGGSSSHRERSSSRADRHSSRSGGNDGGISMQHSTDDHSRGASSRRSSSRGRSRTRRNTPVDGAGTPQSAGDHSRGHSIQRIQSTRRQLV
uniref:Uncharacterized protein n=1 Tax=Corethron hystrix TaxID=216773 RepID=A0A7S1G390_9STRA|mmetsp:Transcript_8334/g.18185  ORF Transcript_8334/g.18185 Transcript_8334/m.18185 type:complete len:1069 (+) Transcript_8334:296-3502(+)